MLEVIKTFASGIIAFGFIQFVVIRLFRNLNFKKKAIVSLVVGIIELIISVSGILIDLNHNITVSIQDGLLFLYYYAYVIVSVLYIIILPLVLFLIGKSRHQKFRSFAKKKEKLVYTIHDTNEYVYAVIKYNGDFLLKNINDSYTGIIEKLSDKILFHDEMIKKIISKYNLTSDYIIDNMYSLVGEVKQISKKDKHYYCYVVEVNNLNNLDGFTKISPYELLNYQLSDFDKQILYHIILKDYFKLEIKEEIK